MNARPSHRSSSRLSARRNPGQATLAVRQSLARFLDGFDLHSGPHSGLGPGVPVVCGVSGGGDSLALAAACVHAGLAVTTVTVDHGLQEGSADIAAQAADQCRELGAEAIVVQVQVDAAGEGPARTARYRALGNAAAGRPVFVAHTADDDAEGLLLALARGSGTGSLAGMREITRDHPVVDAGASFLGRPLLEATRTQTRASCHELELRIWDDPHNESPEFVRSRVRHELLPMMREILGDGVDTALTRSAHLLREDADLLNEIASRELASADVTPGGGLPVNILAEQPGPVRRRMLRIWLHEVSGPLTSRHLNLLDALVVRWRGQGPVAIPWPVFRLEQHTELSYLPSSDCDPPCGTSWGSKRNTHRLVVHRRNGVLETIPLLKTYKDRNR